MMNIFPNYFLCVSRHFTKNILTINSSININSYLRHFTSTVTAKNLARNDLCLCKPVCNNVQSTRSYAKSKDKGKNKGKNLNSVYISPTQISLFVDYEKLTSEYDGVIERMKDDFAKNLSLRSATGAIETLKVPYDGKDFELQELAQIIRKNPKTIVLNMSSFPAAIPDALKAIQGSGLNLNPQQDGTTVFLPVPKVTKEHREHLAKNAKVLFQKYKDIVRDINVDQIKSVKSKTGVSIDTIRSVENQLSAVTNKYYMEAKNLLAAKLDELVGKDK